MIRMRYATEEEKKEYKGQVLPRATSEAIPPSTKEIVFYRKPTGVTLAHELAHIKLGHLDWEEDSTEELVSDEVDAWLQTYKTSGRPRSILGRFRGIVYDCYAKFNTPPSRTKSLIKVKLMRKGVPKQWLRELSSYQREGGV